MVHFVESEVGYYSAYRYACKHYNEVFRSESHPNATQNGYAWPRQKVSQSSSTENRTFKPGSQK